MTQFKSIKSWCFLWVFLGTVILVSSAAVEVEDDRIVKDDQRVSYLGVKELMYVWIGNLPKLTF